MNGRLRILLLDASLAFTVIAVAVAVLLPHARHGINKAALSETMLQSRVGQTELMERLAINGPEGLIELPGSDTPFVRMEVRTELVGQIAGDKYLLSGKQLRGGAPFNLAFAPSYIQGEPSGSVNWLCGTYGAKAGWYGPVAGPGADLAAEDTLFVCRARKGAAPATAPKPS